MGFKDLVSSGVRVGGGGDSTLRSQTTGEFHGSHTESILPSQFQKTIVRKLSVRCGSRNYGTRFEHSRLRTKSRFVRNHMKTC